MFKKNTAVTGFSVGLVSATDGSDITTGTPVGYYTLDGGAQTAIGDVTPVHEGNGLWSFDLTAGEMNGDIVALTFTHTSAITAHFTIKTDTKLVSELNDIAATAIVSGGAINTTTGAVDNVTTVATTTTNTDMRGTDNAALATALATAQTDLDTITGSDGVTLATTQALYAPSKAGDDMGLSATATSAQLVDDIYDEAESGHNVAGSFGKGFRQVKEGTVSVESTINDAGATTTSFITALTEATDDHYKDTSMVFIDGALSGQSRPIFSYNGTTKTITLDEALTEAPANGDGFIIKTDHVHPISDIQSGLSTLVATDIVSSGPITTSAGAVANVDLVDVCTTNTDMVSAAPTAVQNRQEMDSNSTQLAAIIADTADMQPRIGTMETDINNLDLGIIYSTAATGTLTTTSATTNLSGYGDNQLVGAHIIVTSGAAEGERREITAYTSVGGVVEFAAMTSAMANNDTFKIV